MLTARQKEVLEYLKTFSLQHGYMPSLAEIGRALGLSSLATVSKHVENLRRKGYITRVWNRSRGIELVSGHCPHCKRPLGESIADLPMKTEAKGV